MNIVWVLVPLALLLGIGALIGFIWAVKNGQFEDLETPALRILFEENKLSKEKKE